MGDAEHHQAHKDDEGEWSDAVPAPRRRSEKRRLDAMVSVRFTPTEADELRRRSRALGMSLSGYMRYLALHQSRNLSNYNHATVTVAGPVVIHYPDSEAS